MPIKVVSKSNQTAEYDQSGQFYYFDTGVLYNNPISYPVASKFTNRGGWMHHYSTKDMKWIIVLEETASGTYSYDFYYL